MRISTGKTAAVEEGLLLRRGAAAEHGVAVRKAAEAADDVGVQLGPFQAVGVAGSPCRARRSAPGRPGPRNARTAGRRSRASSVPTCASKPRTIARRRRSRAPVGSVAKMRAWPRNMLRGNWSSRISSASAPSALCSQALSLPAAAASRSRESARGFRRRRRRPSRTSASGPASRQNATTSAGATSRHRSCQSGVMDYSSRSARRRILPTLVFGSSARNSMCFGTL